MGMSAANLRRMWKSFEEVNRRAQIFLEEISPFLPRNFSTQFRNPCWVAEDLKVSSKAWEEALGKFKLLSVPKVGKGHFYSQYLMKPGKSKSSGSQQILCLPYFFLAGFPKSATTTIHEVLSRHPSIVGPRDKEPHWWTRSLALRRRKTFNPEYIPVSFMSYLVFFRDIAREMEEPQFDDDLITYDGSQSTIWDSNFYVDGQDFCAMPAVVSKILPSAKFILVMRNPVTRLYSHFVYSCKLRHGNVVHEWPEDIRQGMAALFHSKVEQEIEQFNSCLKNASVFECSSIRTSRTDGPEGDREGARNCSVIWHRLSLGMYVVHVKKWLQFYPMKNFLFLRTEDLSERSEQVLANITDFLGVRRSYRAMSELLGEYKNSHPSQVQPMSLKTAALLQEFYHPYNQELSTLLKDSRFLWKD